MIVRFISTIYRYTTAICVYHDNTMFPLICCTAVDFVLFVSALRIVFPMLPASLNCPFLICFSVFSNVYFLLYDILDLFIFKIYILIYMLPLSFGFSFFFILLLNNPFFIKQNRRGKPRLTRPLFIDVSVSNREYERSGVRGIVHFITYKWSFFVIFNINE